MGAGFCPGDLHHDGHNDDDDDDGDDGEDGKGNGRRKVSI